MRSLYFYFMALLVTIIATNTSQTIYESTAAILFGGIAMFAALSANWKGGEQ
jgi:hypothetical protein